MPDLLQRPKEDAELAKEVMNDIVNVLVKHGCALVHKTEHNMTVLCSVDFEKKQLRALADIEELSLLIIRYRLFGDGKTRTTLQ